MKKFQFALICAAALAMVACTKPCEICGEDPCVCEDETCEVCGGNKVENLAIVTGYLSTDVTHMNKGKQDEVKKRELNIE